MLQLLVLTAIVATCVGQRVQGSANCCSAEDRQAVQSQWNSMWNLGDNTRVKIMIGRALFDRFLAENPGSEDMFGNVNVADQDSGEWNAHMFRVLGGVDILVNMMDDVPTLQSEIQHLAVQHRTRPGVTAERFRSFLTIMVEELPKVIVEFNADSWTACFRRFFQSIASR